MSLRPALASSPTSIVVCSLAVAGVAEPSAAESSTGRPPNDSDGISPLGLLLLIVLLLGIVRHLKRLLKPESQL